MLVNIDIMIYYVSSKLSFYWNVDMPIYSKLLPEDRPKPNIDSAEHFKLQEAERYVTSCFNQLINKDPFIGRVFQNLFDEGFEGVIFGGWVRDRIIEFTMGVSVKSKDIDFVYKGDKNLNKRIFETNLVKRNMFGGYFIDYPTMHIDLWELNKTYLIEKNKLKNNFSSLLITSDYTVNAVIYYPKQTGNNAYLLDAGCINAVESKDLEFLANEVAFPLIQSARAAIFSARFGFTLSNTVHQFIKNTCHDQKSIDEVKDGINKFCQPEFKDKALKIIESVIL
ncbi:hypothetical protein [Pantoea ananatis]|uniref:hypothetical protein n=1 Tax=Pantoea ananas TaxID=553 RepID=UPI00301B4F85